MGKRDSNSKGRKVANPERVRELFSKAVGAIRSGDAATGRQLLLKADRLAPGNASILFNLGYVNHLVGRYTEAVGFYRRCLDRDPELIDGWSNLSAAARESGQLDLAAQALAEVVSRRPGDAAARNDLGNLLVATGEPARALEQYQEALRLDPSRNDARRNQAEAYRLLGRLAETERLLRETIEREPGDDTARRSLVRLLDEQNRVDEAEDVLAAKPGGPTSVEELLLVGNLRLRQGKAALAGDDYRGILEREPGNAAALNNLGLVTVYRGDADEAERLFRKALDADAGFTDPWRNLVALHKYRSEEEADIRTMRSLFDGDLPDGARIQLGFALGKALDDCGLYDEAFACYKAANDTRCREVPFDAEALAHHAGRIRDVFTHDFLAGRADGGSDSSLPVYIVGMPRTGTTLIEQILSAHPDFHGGGELLLINRLITRLENPAGDAPAAYPECVPGISEKEVSRFAADYLEALREVDPEGTAARISDKMPYNFFHLGLVRVLFPHARIIHCVRNPLDACLSAYFNYFPRGLDFTYRFEDLAAFYRIYSELMTYWRGCAGIEFLDIHYENVVADPESTIRGALEHVGLPWDPIVLSFHEGRRAVQTLSAWQVRQPLHRSSEGRWRRYESHIQPLLEALGGGDAILSPD